MGAFVAAAALGTHVGLACHPHPPFSSFSSHILLALQACSFSDWLQSHTLEAALKAKCGCEAAAAGLRQLLIPSQHPSEASQQQKKKQRHGGPGSASAAAARTAALGPGGEVTRRFLAPNPVVLQVGSTLFVHGGLLRQHVDHGLGSINREAQVC